MAQSQFQTTHWSVILRARNGSENGSLQDSLQHVAERYWFPLYSYVRRSASSADAAADLIQSFFVHLLSSDLVGKADPAQGRFRTFLLTSLKNFLAAEHKRETAAKRGGGQRLISIDADVAEARFSSEPVDLNDPERLFDRAWAMNLIGQALDVLGDEYRDAGRKDLFEALKPVLAGEKDCPAYAAVGDRLGMTEGNVKIAVHRLRKRYRELLRGIVASTIPAGADVDAELRELSRILRGG